MKLGHKLLGTLLLGGLALAGCGKKAALPPDTSGNAEPDKVLYDRALNDVQHGRYGVARLALQTLINTYPDSEYLAKAKLAIADSYYKEGGTSGLTQAGAEYQDFITFFPFLDESAYAQMQIGMSHYRRMEKPDRDRTEARLAEQAFQTFAEKYPQSSLLPQAEQHLREVQEVLAEGDFRIAHFYYVKGSNRAAAARLLELTSRYPLYSQADKALWMLGGIFERNEKGDIAARFYSRIVRDYPLSPLVADAKTRLTKLGVPVPQPDPVAVARMEKEKQLSRQHPGLLRRSLGIIKSGPDVSMAARVGDPTMTPEGEASSGLEAIAPTGQMNVGTTGGGTGNTAVVERVTPGSAASTPAPASSSSTAPNPQAGAAGAENPSGTSGTSAAPEGASVDPKAASAENAGTAAKSDQAQADNKKDEKKKGKKDDKKKESSSKKKKGLRKIIPW